MNELYSSLFSIAVFLSGYPENSIPQPHVIRAPQEYFVRTSCRNIALNCKTLGNYRGGNYVFIHEKIDLNTAKGASILVHEYVHFLQIYHGMSATTCRDRINLEINAYEIQRKFLRYRDADDIVVTWDMVQHTCAKEELNLE